MTQDRLAVGRSSDIVPAFWEAARGGTLLLQRCVSCSRLNPFTVTQLCHHCGATDLDLVPSDGRGTVLSLTRVAMPSDAGPERIVVLVELDEGIRVPGVGEGGDALSIDDRVRFGGLDACGALAFERVCDDATTSRIRS